jgi:putative ABC transport system ATP-binding protein
VNEPSILRFTWQYSRKAQLFILIVVLASMPTYFLSLDLPKQIVNGPILGQGFEQPGAAQKLLELSFSFGGETYMLFEGFELERMPTLFALAGLFLTLIIVNGLFKFYINTYKGRLGERMLRRIRYDLVDKLLRFPVRQFRKVKSSEIASMVKDEVEPIGGFMGDAFVQPLFLGGQAITAMVFIMVQNVWLGLIAISMIAVQFVLIPRLRRHLIRLGKQRQIAARKLSGRVGEIVDGINHVHVNDTSHYERADISSRLAEIFYIRYELFQRKFFAKFLNNLLAQFTPFLFYVIGGYFALQGKIDVGQLVAVIAAYKDLPSPIKELIDWDQQRLDVEVKFAQVVEQFDIEDMLERNQQRLPDGAVPGLPFPIELNNVTVSDDAGNILVNRVRFNIVEGDRVALVGSSNSGADVVAETLVRLNVPEVGQVTYGGKDMFELNESQLGRRIGYASAEMFLPQGTMRDSLLYALKHQPVADMAYEGPDALSRQRFIAEARLTDNTDLDFNADWLNFAHDVDPSERSYAVHRLLVSVLEACALKDDVFNMGLRGKVDPEANPGFVERVLAAREKLRTHISDLGLERLIELFDPERYANEATVGENLLFGTPVGDTFEPSNMVSNSYLRQTLRKAEVEDLLVEKGVEMADTTIGLFQDLPPDHELFNQLTFMDGERLPRYQGLLRKIKQSGRASLDDDERYAMVELMFDYIEPQHRMGLVDDDLRARMLKARKLFKQDLPEDLKGSVSFYDPDNYNAAASVQDNLLMGRVSYGIARAEQRVGDAVSGLLAEMGLMDEVLGIGLEFDVGSGGRRLSSAQRQKVGLGRALIKQPDLLVLNRPVNALDARQQAGVVENVMKFIEAQDKVTAVVWVLSSPSLSSYFDTVCVFDGGQLVEQGPRDDLEKGNGAFAQLLAS